MIDTSVETLLDVWDKLQAVLQIAKARHTFGDDEHRSPLPIYGSARMYDRRPLADNRYTPIETVFYAREQMHAYWRALGPAGVFNEEGD